MMQLSIIIPTMDRQTILERSLECAVEATHHINAEIIVVNDSKTTVPDISRFHSMNVRLFNNPKKGVASARNLGASLASSDLLLFLDDDIQINRDSIDQVISLHNNHKHIGVNPDWIYPPDLQEKLTHTSFGRFLIAYQFVTSKGWYNHSRWRDMEMFESPLLASFHLSMSKQDFNSVQGYNEIFPYAGFEDHDFPVRLRKAGIKLYINTCSRVYHNEADRQDLVSWLERQVRGAQTRKVGVSIGYEDLVIHYSHEKKIVLQFLLMLKPLILFVASAIPNRRTFDFIYFRFVLALQAICIFEGYHKR